MIQKDIIKKTNELLEKLYEYVGDESIAEHFENFVKEEITDEINSKEKLLEVIQAFVFDHYIDEKNTMLDIFIREHSDLEEGDLEILKSWKTTIHSIFMVNKVGKDYFDCYNLVNEKHYTIKTLNNFYHYKGISNKDYIFCRIAPVKDHHIVIGNLIDFSKRSKREMLEMAIMVQIQNPIELFRDNPAKLEEIYENNSIKFQKFYDMFDSDEVYTTGENLDELITAFTKYCELGEIDKKEIITLTGKTSEFYYDTTHKKLDVPADTQLSMISEFASLHDAGMIFDKKEGLTILPFYATFMEIMTSPEYKNIKNYKECVEFYLNDENISPFPFVKALTIAPDNVQLVLRDVLSEPNFTIDADFDPLMEEYKFEFIYNNKISPITVFDQSKAFKELMEIYEEMDEMEIDIEDFLTSTGRNDPCPCGSGKKFKKCCLTKVS